MFNAFKNRKQSSEEKIDELLSAYLDGVLALDERAELETRLQQEPALVSRLEGLRQTKRALAGLPQVEVPRNFILSPAMVAPSRPAAPASRRRTWPVFGWATAAVALLFVVVFAGDLFVISPSARPEPSAVAVMSLEQELADRAKFGATGVAGAEAEVVPEPEWELSKVASDVAATETRELAKEMPTQEEGMIAAPAAAEEAPPVVAEGENAAAARVMPTQEGTLMMAVPEVPSEPGTPPPTATPSPLASATAHVAGTPVPAAALPTAPSPADLEKPETDIGSPVTPEVIQEAIPIAPFDATPMADEARQDVDRTLTWLRWIEVALGTAVIGLATATLILRRRDA